MKALPRKIFLSMMNGISAPLVSTCFGNFCPIFMIHRVYESGNGGHGHSTAYLSQCLQHLQAKKYNILSLAELAQLIESREQVPKRSVVFTADDGFIDQAQLGGALFSQYDAPMTFFVISSFLDRQIWPWDDQVKYIVNSTKRSSIDTFYPSGDRLNVNLAFTQRERKTVYELIRTTLKKQAQSGVYDWLPKLFDAAEVEPPGKIPDDYLPMQWSDAQKLINDGHSVAPHTKTHRILSQLDDSDSRSEILGSIETLANRLNGASNLFAYPTGRAIDYGSREIDVLKNAGIQAAVSTTAGAVGASSPQFELPRYPLPTNLNTFIQYLGAFEFLRSRWG